MQGGSNGGRGNGEISRAVTIHDVARHAGVSSMTVSRVVNGSGQVGELLRMRVERAVLDLDYRPNLAARAARQGAIRIGVLFSNPRSTNLGAFLMGAFGESSRLGCQLLVEPMPGRAKGTETIGRLIHAGADGLILPPPLCDSPEALGLVFARKLPVLSFASGDPRLHTSAVMIDDSAGARHMTRHLIALGHRDIAFVRGDPTHTPALRREEGFRAGMAEAGLDVRPEWLPQGYFTYRSGLDIGRALLDRPAAERPTAIFASNDDMAAALVAVAHGLSIRIPADLSIAGFDDSPMATSVWPQLTTVHQPIVEMATRAITLVHEMIRARRSGVATQVTHHVSPFALRDRGSTAAPRAAEQD